MLLGVEVHCEFGIVVEVVFDRAFVATGDEDDLADAGLDQFFDDVVNDGRRPTGSISLGRALVVGRSRVPRPATGTMALVMLILVSRRAKASKYGCTASI